jgi:hypothetical protein
MSSAAQARPTWRVSNWAARSAGLRSHRKAQINPGGVLDCPGTGEDVPREMVTERHLSQRGSVRPKLAAITVSRCHLILVFRSPGELADLEHVQAEPLDLCEHAV